MPEPQQPQPDRPCSRCNCPLKFAVNASTGKTVPLDLRSPVYLVFERADGSQFAWSAREFVEKSAKAAVLMRAPGSSEVEELRLLGVYVSHFATCPSANQFSGRGAAKGAV